MLSSEKPNQLGKVKTCLKTSDRNKGNTNGRFFYPLPVYFSSPEKKDNRILENEGKKTSVPTQKNTLSLGHSKRQV